MHRIIKVYLLATEAGTKTKEADATEADKDCITSNTVTLFICMQGRKTQQLLHIIHLYASPQ